jgi:small subunit ribosomal protein S21
MVMIAVKEGDRLEFVLKAFKKQVARAGILKELRKRRHFEKPSQVRKRKIAAAKRRLMLKGLPPRKRAANTKAKRF